MMNCEVRTKNGIVRGKCEEGIMVWKGIPYAKKPLGEYRFRKAQAPDNWTGVLETVEWSKKPIQPDFLTSNPDIEESEDCLYLNIWSNGTEEKKPVVVFIYGSAYIIGESSLLTYDGSSYAKDGIVFVSFNHRVGIFGGYDLSHLNGGNQEFDPEIMISDQIQALRWVRDNIEQFGGNPEDVTIMGESAGASSVINLIASPAAKGLFHKAISQSVVIRSVVDKEIQNINMRVLLEHLEIKEENIAHIKDMETQKLEEAPLWLMNNYSRRNPGIFLPGFAYGGELFPEFPLVALEKGCGKGIKLMIGTNQDEASLFIHGESSNMVWTKEEIEQFFNHCGTPKEVQDKLEDYYDGFQSMDSIKAFCRDFTFTRDSVTIADIQSQIEDTYMYYFSYLPQPATNMGIGCYHGLEIPFSLGTTDISEMKNLYGFSDKDSLNAVSHAMYLAWTNFIKYGNPNGEGQLPWPKYDKESRKVYHFDTECEVLDNPHGKMYEAFEGLRGYEDIK